MACDFTSFRMLNMSYIIAPKALLFMRAPPCVLWGRRTLSWRRSPTCFVVWATPHWSRGGGVGGSRRHKERKKDSIAFLSMDTSITTRYTLFYQSNQPFHTINLPYNSSPVHFCFLQTSIFTPSFGTPTKVRISSRMTTNQVIEQLLNKFKVRFCAFAPTTVRNHRVV